MGHEPKVSAYVSSTRYQVVDPGGRVPWPYRQWRVSINPTNLYQIVVFAWVNCVLHVVPWVVIYRIIPFYGFAHWGWLMGGSSLYSDWDPHDGSQVAVAKDATDFVRQMWTPKGFQDSWTHCIKLISWSKLGTIEYSLYNAGSSRRELILL